MQILSSILPIDKQIINSPVEYSEFLNLNGIKYTSKGLYLQVGEAKRVQGWVINLSIIIPQLSDLLQILIPWMTEENLVYKIPKNKEAASMILNGSVGYNKLAKVITIFPDNDEQALSISSYLIEKTRPFKGPKIPTDLRLGGIVYTRFGAIDPILIKDTSGQVFECIYNQSGELVLDEYEIPFKLPKGIIWPYGNITPPSTSRPSKLLNYKYYPIATIKPDVKGFVLKALYFKNIFRIKTCLIKQGRQNMFTDNTIRDIRDRLKWQYDLYKELSTTIPIPRLFDFFQQEDDSYLVMDFIKGPTLLSQIGNVYNGKCWHQIDASRHLKLLHYLIQVLEIIQKIHTKGYIHRDVTPANFIVDKDEKIWAIDMELTWCAKTKTPAPPFDGGTPGHMSPEQTSHGLPTVKEDVYGFGGLMIWLFTNLPAHNFDYQSSEQLFEDLHFFIQDKVIAKLIVSCLDYDPFERPDLKTIHNVLTQYDKQPQDPRHQPLPNQSTFSDDRQLSRVINFGLKGLLHSPLISSESLWFSKVQLKENAIGNEQFEFSYYEGLHTGIAGVQYLIARANRSNFDISDCLSCYSHGFKFIQTQILTKRENNDPGLYHGTAGIAVAIAEGYASGLLSLDQINLEYIFSLFPSPNSSIDLSGGSSGQGIALLHTISLINDHRLDMLLEKIISDLLNSQQSNGSWLLSSNTAKVRDINIGLDNGVSGIVWFLLHIYQVNKSAEIKQAITKALAWIIGYGHKKRKVYAWSRSTKEAYIDLNNFGKGTPGVLLTFIKAFEITQEPLYREIAVYSLRNFPSSTVRSDFTISRGLAGIGEIYLEAYATFHDSIWLERAAWIASLFIHNFHHSTATSGYWLVDGTTVPTADFFTGNCGVLDFLIRYSSKGKLNHPLSIGVR